MMILWDTSALVRALVPVESAHLQARSLLEKGTRHGGSLLLRAELIATLIRRAHGGNRGAARRLGGVKRLLDAFAFVPFDPGQLVSTDRLIEHHGLKGPDAIHLAAALFLAAQLGRTRVRFASSDHEQLAAARKEGLRVVEITP